MGGTAEGASRGEVLDLHGEAASAVLRQWRGAADEASLPKHIAIIPDGNRRWAKQRGMPSSFGHHKGTKRMNEVVQWVLQDLQIKYLTVFALSRDNVSSRSEEELRVLYDILAVEIEALAREPFILESRIRVKVVGEIPAGEERLARAVEAVEALTHTWGEGGTLTHCVAYTGRMELAAAARKVAEAVERGELASKDVDEDTLGRFLYTAGDPGPDLVIRTSGEKRLSNFLLWQSAYSELIFPPVAWPDFGLAELLNSLDEYRGRGRRFGK